MKHKNYRNTPYGVKEFDNPGPPHTKPKTHAEEEKMAEDE